MSVISPSTPEVDAIPGCRTAVIASIWSWLEGLKGRLFAGRADEFLRNLDQRTREDFGVASWDRDESPISQTRAIPEGMLRDAFSWLRFSK
jgi:hypothetical protein